MSVTARRKYVRVVPGATTKVCRRCRATLPIEAFGIRRASTDGKDSYCRACLALPDVVEAKRSAMTAHRVARREELDQWKRRPCMDCGGVFPPVCMQFDHRDAATKVTKVSAFSRGGKAENFLAEIAKCDLVCANCHAIRTERRRLEARR